MGYNHAAPNFFHALGHPRHKKQYLASPVHQRDVVDDQNVHARDEGNDSNLLIVFYVQIMPD
ncbi:hypothetical protein PPECC9_13360, partial [Escherichia coli PCN009]